MRFFMPRFVLKIFQGDHDQKRSLRALFRLLETLVEIDLDYLRAYPETPALYDSGVTYKEQDGDLLQEDWHDVPSAIAAKKTDCKVLACWRVAELRQRGVKARPYVLVQPRKLANGTTVYYNHIQVEWPDGTIEDPSKVLGMP